LTCDISPYPVYFNLQNFGTDRQIQISEHIPTAIRLISLENAFWRFLGLSLNPGMIVTNMQTESIIGGRVKNDCSVDSVLS
jgi:hypothetical protein